MIKVELASWFVDDPLPQLPHLDGFWVEVAGDVAEMALINGLPDDAVQRRIELGNRPYIARHFGRPAGYGWVATDLAHIGELGLSFRLAHSDRYLWEFEVLSQCLGLAVYSRLLQGIVLHEEASRFWLAHDDTLVGESPDGGGFCEVGELSYRPGRGAVLEPAAFTDRASAASAVLGVPLAEAPNGAVEGGPGRARACVLRDSRPAHSGRALHAGVTPDRYSHLTIA